MGFPLTSLASELAKLTKELFRVASADVSFLCSCVFFCRSPANVGSNTFAAVLAAVDVSTWFVMSNFVFEGSR